MEKNHKKPFTIIHILFILVTLFAVNRLFDWFVINTYINLIDQKGFIETFNSASQNELNKLQKENGIKYLTVRNSQIVNKSDQSLPTIHPLVIQTKKNSLIIPTDYRTELKKIRPFLSLQKTGLYIGFPLVFENNTDQYIIFDKIIP